ncbi:hypothetical protein GGI43DRAFT_310944 [Trichoderma evansii]
MIRKICVPMWLLFPIHMFSAVHEYHPAYLEQRRNDSRLVGLCRRRHLSHTIILGSSIFKVFAAKSGISRVGDSWREHGYPVVRSE